MKVPFVQKSYALYRFNERTNTIESDCRITTTRTMTPAEAARYCHLYLLYIFWCVVCGLGVVIGFIPIICSFAGIVPDWFAAVGLICFGSLVFPLRGVMQYHDDYQNLLNNELPKVGFEEEDAAHESMEEYIQSCADAWRAAHPLEEKIRLAQQSGNCVDIAELVRYCGADLADKLK